MKVKIVNKPIIFQNSDFQTIQIKVFFPFKREDADIAKMHLLPGLLHNVCSKYPSEEEFTMVCKNLYILANYCTCNVMGDIGYFCFNFMIPDSKHLDSKLLEEQLSFFHEMIYNPKTNKDKFCYDEFKREVDNLNVDIDKVLKDNVSFALIEAKKVVDDGGLFSSNIYNHRDQIDKVNEKDLYEYYKKNICSNAPLIYIFGDVKNTKIDVLAKKYLYNNNSKEYSTDICIKNYLPVRNDIKDIIYKSDFKNSVLIEFYKIKDMSYDDEVLIGTVKELLNSLGSRILNKKLRDEGEFVYSSYAISYNNYGLFGIVALIQNKNIDLVKEKIREALLVLKDENYINDLLNNIKEKHRLNLIRRLDDKTSLFQDEIVNDLGIEISPQEYYQKLCNLSTKDISEFVDRLVLDTIYFLEEAEHE